MLPCCLIYVPGCSCGSKQLLLPEILSIVNLVHFCVMFVTRSATQPKKTMAAVVEIQFTVLISIFSLRKQFTYNFVTTKFVLLPGLAHGSKSLLPPKKMHF